MTIRTTYDRSLQFNNAIWRADFVTGLDQGSEPSLTNLYTNIKRGRMSDILDNNATSIILILLSGHVCKYISNIMLHKTF